MNRFSHLIWDWNGTLFDDLDWCIDVINTMLERRELPTLKSRAEYHDAFCFPIIDYYKNVGFDFEKEPFSVLAEEYIRAYHAENSGGCKLHKGAEEALRTINRRGISQTVLSASRSDNLAVQMSSFNISGYFDEVLGIRDIYAASKVGIGREFMSRVRPEHALVVGDSVHDFEVAQAIGADCVLIASGHQSKSALKTCGVTVFDDISELASVLF